MRFDLKVPFAEKDAAKKLGARWDAARKIWYFLGDPAKAEAFAQWSPSAADPAAPRPAAGTAPARSAAPQTSAGKLQIGARYIERPSPCACPPWQDCELCRI